MDIRCKGLVRTFNELTISYEDLEFLEGETYLLLGPSGCGKSTLLNLIAGVIAPDSGTVICGDHDMGSLSKKERDYFRVKEVGYVYQDFKLIPDMTVADNIEILKLEGINVKGMDSLLEHFGIADKKNAKVSNLSGGQKQRVGIVRALIKNPSVILADEPTGALNFEIGEQVVKDLLKAAEGKVLIVVSHDERLIPYFRHVIRINEISRCTVDTVGQK